MLDIEKRICRSAYFSSLEEANDAFTLPNLFVELRFDLSNFSVADILKIKRPSKLIFTCRKGKYSFEERLKAYSFALELGVEMVDLDFENDLDLIRKLNIKIKDSNTKLILSSHNYESSPSMEMLKEKAQKAFALGADFVKIVTSAQSLEQIQMIENLYSHFDHLIAFSMGNIGEELRAKILYLGAPFTYASFDNINKTASGQLDYHQTLELVNSLKKEAL